MSDNKNFNVPLTAKPEEVPRGYRGVNKNYNVY